MSTVDIDAAFALRRYDDLAKEAGRRVVGDDRPGIDAHEPLLRRVIRAGTTS